MKRSVEWHQGKLDSYVDNINGLIKQIVNLQMEIDDLERRRFFLYKQVDEAIRLKKTSFDARRFLLKENLLKDSKKQNR